MPTSKPINPYPSYAEQTQQLQRAFEVVVENNNRAVELLQKGMASDYSKMLIKLKNILSNAHEQYATTPRLNWQEMQRYDRIKKLEIKVNDAIKEGYKPIGKRIIDEQKDIIRNTYDGTLRALSTIPNVSLEQTLTADEINIILQKPWSGVSMTERIALRVSDLGVRVNSSIKQGLMGDGTTYKESIDGVKEVVTKAYARDKGMVEDTAHQFQSDSQQEAMNTAMDDGYEITKTWVTAGDDKVRDAHAELDGQTVLGDEMFEIPSGEYAGYKADGPGLFGDPALDYGCRCFLVSGVRQKGE